MPPPDSVTLCCVDTAHHFLSSLALKRSAALGKFAKVIFITDKPEHVDSSWEFHRIRPFATPGDYDRFMLKSLYYHVDTPFVLCVRYNGFILDPASWTDDFLTYDYIGAPWPNLPKEHAVGNGDFSLRSRKLLTALQDDRISLPGQSEDVCISSFRSYLEKRHGIRIAPVELASHFSYENGPFVEKTFGFHGMKLLADLYAGKDALMLIDNLQPHMMRSDKTVELAIRYLQLKRNEEATCLLHRLFEHRSMEEVKGSLLKYASVPPEIGVFFDDAWLSYKAMKSGHSAKTPELKTVREAGPSSAGDAILLKRMGGMGDVLMVLGAAKAVKATYNEPLYISTAPAFRSLVEACPYVDGAITYLEELRALEAKYGTKLKSFNAGPAAYGLSSIHQIDAYLNALCIHVPAELKEIEIKVSAADEAEVEKLIATFPPLSSPSAKRILIHPSNGDVNRTWPKERWEELATRLIALGHQVIAIGNNSAVPDKGAQKLGVPEVLSAIDRLNLLGTVALTRKADLLVSTDGGPIQMAGASDIGIVGIYSTVEGANRLPFRHGKAGWRAASVKPECKFYPCYKNIYDHKFMTEFRRTMPDDQLTINGIFSHWCTAEDQYRCLKKEVTVDMVFDACMKLLDEKPGMSSDPAAHEEAA